jgi:hypothetical protein
VGMLQHQVAGKCAHVTYTGVGNLE